MDLMNLLNYISAFIGNGLLYIVLWGITIYVIIWLVRELYYWAKYHLMGLFRGNDWNQYRRR